MTVQGTLAAPTRDANIAFRADWLELNAIIAGIGTAIGASALTDAFDIDLDNDDDPEAEEYFRIDYIARSLREIARRRDLLGTSYPFALDERNENLTLQNLNSLDRGVYIFCLLLTAMRNVSRYGNIASSLGTNNEVADLFQICATVAAGGFTRGHAVSFGWPRPDDAPFLEALAAVFLQMGEGQARHPGYLAPGASESPKDAGIDVIAWRPSIDTFAGKMFMLGQSASGMGWEEKSVKPYIENFYHFWVSVHPVSHPIPAMFIPFPMELDLAADDARFESSRRDQFEGKTKRLGIIFDRFRITYFVREALEITSSGTLPEGAIARISDLQKVRDTICRVVKE